MQHGLIYQLIFIYLWETGLISNACPSGCTCDNTTKVLACYGWKDPKPPYVSDTDDYESLDLSSDSGIEILEPECIDTMLMELNARLPLRCPPGRGGACAGGADEGAAEGETAGETDEEGRGGEDGDGGEGDEGGGLLLGDALEAGRLPASWLGSGRFVWLQRLRLRGAGLRLVHKDAFRYQLKLRCVDLSNNRLARLNLFTWHRHNEMRALILAGNKGLNLPSDAPLLYSKSLLTLNLSGCGLKSLHSSVFDGVPSLKKLDLSNNELYTISSTIAEYLAQISDVILKNNNWKCDCILMETWQRVRNLSSKLHEKLNWKEWKRRTEEEVLRKVKFDILCSSSNRSWNVVFETGDCEITTTSSISTATENIGGLVDVMAVEGTTEETIHLGGVNEIEYNENHCLLISTIISTICILSQIFLCLAVWWASQVSAKPGRNPSEEFPCLEMTEM